MKKILLTIVVMMGFRPIYGFHHNRFNSQIIKKSALITAVAIPITASVASLALARYELHNLNAETFQEGLTSFLTKMEYVEKLSMINYSSASLLGVLGLSLYSSKISNKLMNLSHATFAMSIGISTLAASSYKQLAHITPQIFAEKLSGLTAQELAIANSYLWQLENLCLQYASESKKYAYLAGLVGLGHLGIRLYLHRVEETPVENPIAQLQPIPAQQMPGNAIIPAQHHHAQPQYEPQRRWFIDLCRGHRWKLI